MGDGNGEARSIWSLDLSMNQTRREMTGTGETCRRYPTAGCPLTAAVGLIVDDEAALAPARARGLVALGVGVLAGVGHSVAQPADSAVDWNCATPEGKVKRAARTRELPRACLSMC